MRSKKTAPRKQGAETHSNLSIRFVNNYFDNRNIVAITYDNDNDMPTRQEQHDAREMFLKRVRGKETVRRFQTAEEKAAHKEELKKRYAEQIKAQGGKEHV